MSRFSSTSQTAPAPFDEAAEARELEEFFRHQDPVNMAAIDWHTRQEQGLSAVEQIEFRQWLAASSTHAAAFEQLDQGVVALRAEHRQTTPVSAAQNNATRQRENSWLSGWFSLFLQPSRRTWVAFSCIILLVAGIGLYQWDLQRTFSRVYVVERGQQQMVTLPDGSELAFDAQTQAQVTLYRDHREVHIKEGQIMFAVAPDSAKPFHVLAGAARVTVVGTRFSVGYRHTGMDANSVNVAVEEGHVKVADTSNAQNDAVVDLRAGQRVAISANGAIGQVADVAPDSIALWRKGLVRFENTPLGEALLELERYGSTGIVIRDPIVAAMPIGGSFKIGRPEEFTRMVTQILPVRQAQGAAGTIEIVIIP